MITLGGQLSAADYEAFKAALAQQLPNVNVQTINAAGRFCINGVLTDADIATINTIYGQRSAKPTQPQFDLMAYQERNRRQRQTHNARMKRSAMAMRFGR